MKIDWERVEKAKDFATKKHKEINQKRKYTGEDYIVHPESVAKIVYEFGGSTEEIMAAWLHDTLEDTNTTYLELLNAFGISVTSLVVDLTDVSKPEDGNRAIRKKMDRDFLVKNASYGAQFVKLADTYDNTISICTEDERFAKTYLVEKMDLINGLKDHFIQNMDNPAYHRQDYLFKAVEELVLSEAKKINLI